METDWHLIYDYYDTSQITVETGNVITSTWKKYERNYLVNVFSKFKLFPSENVSSVDSARCMVIWLMDVCCLQAEELDEAAEELLLAVTKDDDTEAEKMNAGQQAEGGALESVAATGVTAALIATADVTEPVLTDATVIVADAVLTDATVIVADSVLTDATAIVADSVSTDATVIVADSVSTDAAAIVADAVSTDATAIVADAVSTDATAIVADAVSTDATAIIADAVSTDATAIVADAVSTDATVIVADSISTGITADATVIKTDESIEDVQEATLADVTTTITDASSAGVTESVNGDEGVGAELEQAEQPADVSVVVNGQTTSDVDTGVGDTQIDPQVIHLILTMYSLQWTCADK